MHSSSAPRSLDACCNLQAGRRVDTSEAPAGRALRAVALTRSTCRRRPIRSELCPRCVMHAHSHLSTAYCTTALGSVCCRPRSLSASRRSAVCPRGNRRARGADRSSRPLWKLVESAPPPACVSNSSLCIRHAADARAQLSFLPTAPLAVSRLTGAVRCGR